MKKLTGFRKLAILSLLAIILVGMCSSKTASAAPTGTKITLDCNGGNYKGSSKYTLTVASTTEYGLTLSTIKPTRTGCNFTGWYTKPVGGEKVSSSKIYTTIYAHWALKTCKVSLNGNGQAPSTTKTCTYGDQILLPTVSCATLSFLGWAKTSKATTPTYHAGSYYKVTGDETLYAVWHKHTVKGGDCSHNGKCSICGLEIANTCDKNRHTIIDGSSNCKYCNEIITYESYLYAEGKKDNKDSLREYLNKVWNISENLFVDKDVDMWKDIINLVKNYEVNAVLNIAVDKGILTEYELETFNNLKDAYSIGKQIVDIYNANNIDTKTAAKKVIELVPKIASKSGLFAKKYFEVFSKTINDVFSLALKGNEKILEQCGTASLVSDGVTIYMALKMCTYVYRQCTPINKKDGKLTVDYNKRVDVRGFDGFENSEKVEKVGKVTKGGYTLEEAITVFKGIYLYYMNDCQ